MLSFFDHIASFSSHYDFINHLVHVTPSLSVFFSKNKKSQEKEGGKGNLVSFTTKETTSLVDAYIFDFQLNRDCFSIISAFSPLFDANFKLHPRYMCFEIANVNFVTHDSY